MGKYQEPGPPLGDNYRHYNSLIWQVPSWGSAIGSGIIVAAFSLDPNKFDSKVLYFLVRCSILLFGTVFLIVLCLTLWRYRVYQASFVNRHIKQKPPFETGIKANRWLQFVMFLSCGMSAWFALPDVCLLFGRLIGLELDNCANAFRLLLAFPVICGVIIAFIYWECRYDEVVGLYKKLDHIYAESNEANSLDSEPGAY